MLHLLTNYLLQYKTVGIPHVGTIQIIHHPATIDVANKMIEPPGFTAELKGQEEVTPHQLQYLAQHLDKDKEEVVRDLNFFGDKLQDKINGPGFEWAGLGLLTRSTQSLPVLAHSLQPVSAQRVIRTNVPHTILVGDQQRMSSQPVSETEPVTAVKKKKPLLILIAWALLLLAILAIVYVLYSGRFKVGAAGSQMPVTCYGQTLKEPLINVN